MNKKDDIIIFIHKKKKYEYMIKFLKIREKNSNDFSLSDNNSVGGQISVCAFSCYIYSPLSLLGWAGLSVLTLFWTSVALSLF